MPKFLEFYSILRKVLIGELYYNTRYLWVSYTTMGELYYNTRYLWVSYTTMGELYYNTRYLWVNYRDRAHTLAGEQPEFLSFSFLSQFLQYYY